MDPHFLIALAVAIVVIVSVVFEQRTGLPGPVFLVSAGVALSYVPGLPTLALNPNVVFFVFLPPLLYSAAFFSSPREWRENWRSITLLAVGLVAATLFAVAGAAGATIGGLSWAAAFVLGGVLAPTDPVAATSVIGRLGAPSRLRTVLEGESLANDGVALAIYSLAVSAGLAGSFSVVHGLVRFVEIAVGGVAIGIVLGWMLVHVRRRVHEPMIEIIVSLLTPYAAYLLAQQADVSGVLATVAAGAYLGWQSEGLFKPQVRVQAFAFWGVLTFLLEATLFVLLGAQFPAVVGGLHSFSAGQLILWALAVYAAVVVVRLLWQFTVPHLTHTLDVGFREFRSRTPWRERLLLGWAGMRGAVTLAAALAIPLGFPDRKLVLFLAFSVILATILVQGASLPLLVRVLGLSRPDYERRRELEARAKLAEAALDVLDDLAGEEEVSAEELDPLRGIYAGRVERAIARLEEEGDGAAGGRSSRSIQLDVIRAQRKMLRRLESEGAVDPDTGRRLQRELDLEESRLEAA